MNNLHQHLPLETIWNCESILSLMYRLKGENCNLNKKPGILKKTFTAFPASFGKKAMFPSFSSLFFKVTHIPSFSSQVGHPVILKLKKIFVTNFLLDSSPSPKQPKSAKYDKSFLSMVPKVAPIYLNFHLHLIFCQILLPKNLTSMKLTGQNLNKKTLYLTTLIHNRLNYSNWSTNPYSFFGFFFKQ